MRLTQNDKLVFYGLVQWPDLSDVELSEKVGVKRPTVTAIRHKLEENKLYQTFRIPELSKIGCEMLAVKSGDFNPLAPYSKRVKYFPERFFVDAFFSISTDHNDTVMLASRNFTEVKKFMDHFQMTYGRHKFLTPAGHTWLYFPFESSVFVLHFDFAPALAKQFSLEVDVGRDFDLEFKKPKRREFSDNEKLVYYALIKYPTSSDGEVAKRVGLTRQSVNSMRNTFMREGLMRTVRFPDFERIGFELLTFEHQIHNPDKPLKARSEGIRRVVAQQSRFFLISSNTEGFRGSVYRDYTDFKKTYDEIYSFYRERDLLKEDSTIKIFPLKDVKELMPGRYTPLVKKILEIGGEV